MQIAAAMPFLLPFLLASSFTEEVQLSAEPISRLVEYDYGINFTSLIPGVRYEGNINATWAIPDSALLGLEGKSVGVKITATSQNNSSVFFPTIFDPESRKAEAYLRCDVALGVCANSSVLSAQIPVSIIILENGQGSLPITLQSEVVQSAVVEEEIKKSAGGLFDFLQGILPNNSTSKEGEGNSQNKSGNDSSIASQNQSESGNLLDHLKPEGDSRDPIKFLRQNPLVSSIALAIVVVITGAYLFKAKD